MLAPSSSLRQRCIWSFLLLLLCITAVASAFSQTNSALQFNGSSQYVTFGPAAGLGATTFTLETWFKRTSGGVGTGTGSGGITSAIPLVTKGRAEADGDNRDMNYFLGIDATSGKLVADFEEGPSTGGTLGLNHPVSGNTVVTSNVWHHAAATYDGQTWKVYLDGVLDGTLTLAVPRPPRSDSIQHAALATAMNSTGVPSGYFAGILDEARIWNYARSQEEIQATKNQEITTPMSGLLGRWGMNEGSGTTVGDSAAGSNGTAVGSPVWVTGFPIPDTTPPAAPQGLTASAGNSLVTLVWTANTETDLSGYNIYRSTSSPVPITGTPLNGSTPVTAATFTDHSVANSTPYYYAVIAVDTSNNSSAASVEANATPSLDAGAALAFNGSTQYVTFGPAPGLGSATFTLETWFRRTGPGVGTNTGSGGINDIIPLVSKGRAEADGSNVDMNYILGIQASTNKLAADFEDMATGLNHPVFGTTAITDNAWHHAAATYDGTTWQLYLDGNPEGTVVTNQTPRYDSIQHAGLATALNSTGATAGYFQGVLDEARIWNYARTQQEIVSAKNFEVPSATGLIARWGMNEGSGTAVLDSAGTINGTTTNNPEWVAGFPLAHNNAPLVEAGPAQTITMPALAGLLGSVVDDGLPVPPGSVTTTWSKFSGPGTVTFGDPSQLNTSASFSIDGIYELKLQAFDGLLSGSDTVLITVNSAAVNQPPVANPDTASTTKNTGVDIAVLSNDSDLENEPLIVYSVTTPLHGTVTVNPDQTIHYVPVTDYVGSDSFTYTAADAYAQSPAVTVSITVQPPAGNYAVQFDGQTSYISLGNPAKLGLSSFTLETWFRRTGAGATASTGAGGVVAIPLITKGRHESDGSTVDMNYFLGIDGASGVLVADFEEFTGPGPAGQNRPVSGLTPITSDNTWHHAAATYDSSTGTWNLYLDGNLEKTSALTGSPVPRYDSIEHAAIGTTFDSRPTEVPEGYFDGVIDEVRIWNHALSGAEIRANLNVEISSAAGLVAHWGLNEGVGTTAGDSALNPANGTATGTFTWVAGAPFNMNAAPKVEAGPDQIITLPAAVTLNGTASDDGLPSPPATLTTVWTTISGPGTVAFANPDVATTTATFSVAGTYVLRLTASDSALSNSDDVTVTVNAAVVNQAPVVNAGEDQTITLPTTTNLLGTVTDDGLPTGTVAVAWTMVSGPGTVNFAEPSAAQTTATFSVPGDYVLRLTGNDGALSTSDDVSITVNPQTGNYALQLDGSTGYVGFGNPSKLHLPAFTIEAWFMRTGTGATTTTGTGGIATAIPLVARGRGEAEDPTVDLNYFLGIDSSTNVLAADFEEGASGPNPSLNHPVFGVTKITNGVWHHAAATYDGNKWQLFLDGVLENELVVNRPTAAAGNQYASIGSALNSTGVAAGFFQGTIDEARIWNRALPQSEIWANMDQELTTGNGLVARWGLNEGIGSSVNDSGANPVTGTISGTATWVSGAPFDLNIAPLVNAGPDQTITLPNEATLNGTVSDDGRPNPPGALALTWSQVSGPGSVTFASPNAATTTVTFSLAGTYLLRLTASDSALSNSGDVTVTVNASVVNQAPVVNAGPDQTITLPTNANLVGTVTDDGLPTPPSAVAVNWTIVSGPGDVNFAEPSAAQTTATFSVAGVYVLRLTGNDGALSTSDDITITVSPQTGNYALQFDGSTGYVGFGNPAKLNLPAFTIEAWFMRTGTGATTSTGSGGVVSALPLVTKGRHQSDGSNVDMNYFLGIDTASNNVLAADFEEGATGSSPGLNHPVRGITSIQNNTWYHAAVTYDGSTWRLYLNGNLENSLTIGQPPRSDSIQQAAIASALDSTGAPEGYFAGSIDEARIWNRALSAAEIQANINSELTSGSGLVARWGFNEDTGTSLGDSMGQPAVGTIHGSNWVAGAPFNAIINHPPNPPALVAPADGASDIGSSAPLDVTASDPDGDDVTVTFYGRSLTGAPGPDFMIAVLPDSQYYTGALNGGTPAMLNSQTQWVVNNSTSSNVVYLAHEGDITDGNTSTQWDNANTAMSTLEVSPGIPYGLALGNHDENGGTALFNQYFGADRFTGRPYYGGHYGTDNNNHYDLFSASGLDFIIVYLEYGASGNTAVMSWANNLLQTYSSRKAIIVNHDLLTGPGNPATFSSEGQIIYDTLKANPNLFLMLCGHAPGEGRRSDTYNGNTVYTLLADYQNRTNGGSGWMRLLQFSPMNNTIHVTTYSPWLNQSETDGDSQFDLTYTMASSFSVIGTTTIPSGTHAATTWSGLNASTSYEWYATVSDGSTSTTGATWTFATAKPANRPPTAVDDTATTTEGTSVVVPVLSNDTDPDGDAITLATTTNAAHGTVVANADNTVTYTPQAGFAGTDTFTYTVKDTSNAESNAATVTVTISAVNHAPVANAQTVTTDEDAAKAITLTGSDPDGDSLTYTVVTNPANGTLSGTAPNLTYTPAQGYHGADSFTFKVNDSTVDSTPATVSITINPVNHPPTANAQAVTTDEDTAKAITLTGSDPDGNSLTYAVVTNPAHGTLSGTPPNLTYTPAQGYHGADSFTFKVNDSTVDSTPATVSITVNTVNHPPVANAQTVTTNEDTAKAITLTGSDPDGDSLTYAVVTNPSHGTLSGTAPALTYTPALGYHGADSFTFKVNDNTVDSTPATVSITVNAVNHPPLANAQTVITNEDTPKAITLTGSDPDGSSLTYAVVTNPAHGTLSGSAPSLTYTPTAGYHGADSFTFKVNDGSLDSAPATVSITVNAVNHAPVANAQTVITNEDTPKAITLTGSDPDGDSLTYAVVASPAHGTLSGTAPNLTYTPAPNYNGADSFTFTVRDGQLESLPAIVSITVNPVNDPPVAVNGSVTTTAGKAVSGQLTATDVDNTTLIFSIVGQPKKGSLTISPSGAFTYTPAGKGKGTDSFTFQAYDGAAYSNLGKISVTIK